MSAPLDPTAIAAILVGFPDKVRLCAESMLKAGPDYGPRNIAGRYGAAATAEAARKEERTDLLADIGRLANQNANTVRAWGPIARLWPTEAEFLGEMDKHCANGNPLDFSHPAEVTSLTQLPVEEGRKIARELLQRARDGNLGPRKIGDMARAIVRERKEAANAGLADVGRRQAPADAKRIDDLAAEVAQLREEVRELRAKVNGGSGAPLRSALTVSDDDPGNAAAKEAGNSERPCVAPGASGNGHIQEQAAKGSAA